MSLLKTFHVPLWTSAVSTLSGPLRSLAIDTHSLVLGTPASPVRANAPLCSPLLTLGPGMCSSVRDMVGVVGAQGLWLDRNYGFETPSLPTANPG